MKNEKKKKQLERILFKLDLYIQEYQFDYDNAEDKNEVEYLLDVIADMRSEFYKYSKELEELI